MRNRRPKNLSLLESAHAILSDRDASRYVESVVIANSALRSVCEAVIAKNEIPDAAVQYAASVIRQVPAMTPWALADVTGNHNWNESVLFAVWFVARERAMMEKR